MVAVIERSDDFVDNVPRALEEVLHILSLKA
jgi:hypothetical protein